MSFHVTKAKWLEQIAEDVWLLDSACRIAIVLAKHLNSQSETAWPSVERLAKITGQSDRNIRRVLKMLHDRGHVNVSIGGGRARPNVYSIVLKGQGAAPVPSSPERGSRRKKLGQTCPIKNPDTSVRKTLTRLSGEPLDRNLPPNAPAKSGSDPAPSEPAFDAFEAVWPWEANESRSAGRKAFDLLPSAADKRQAIDAARAAAKKGLAREKLGRASRWLRGRCFQNIAPSPPPTPRRDAPIVTDRGVFIALSSPEWQAWRAKAGEHLETVNTAHGIGCYRPSQWPPDVGGEAPHEGGAR